MSVNTPPKNLFSLLEKSDRVLVTAHIRADGDAIASVCFFSTLLIRMGKSVQAVLHDSNPDNRYSFLHGFDMICAPHSCSSFNPDMVVILDTPTLKRLGDVQYLIRAGMQSINIDHHESNEMFGTVNWVAAASSTCEMLYEIAEIYSEYFDTALAEILYTGICFDTGRFRFSNTSERTFRIAAQLVSKGCDVESITENVFYKWSPVKARMMGEILSGMKLIKNGSVAILKLDHTFFISHPDGWQELEGVSDLGISIDGVDLSIFFKELEPGTWKLSLRSKGRYNVNEIAERFGGGGHAQASGCEIKGDFNAIVDQILQNITSN
ncbi:bifunctional oligoribonuclease/PAP phosphatase NrnA [bacterium]|nr:bifunctional oligoribonuclease/PAP phosphatase NrnA [candidate division CSSED10-310 bacterium]